MSWTNFKKPVLLIFSLILFTTIGIAQSANSVTITVSSTEYDNPSLTGLKEYLKSNSKVKGLKSTFNNSVATLSFTYYATADELWDEIPTDKKQGFKLTSIDSKIIKLQVVKTAPTTNVKTDSKNCGCDYFPLCNYDNEKTFDGEKWKLMNFDGKNAYYHCKNGILRIKTLRYDWDGNFVGYITFTALKANEHEGASWSETLDLGGGIKRTYEHEIIKKNTWIKHNEKIYRDVIKVWRFAEEKIGNTTGGVERGYSYYVKDVGVFKENEVKSAEQIEQEIKQEELISKVDLKQIQSENENHPFFLTLTSYYWVYTRPNGKEIQVQFPKESKRDGNTAFWRIKDNFIEYLYPPGNWYKAYEIITFKDGQKKLKSMQFTNEIYIQSYRKS